MKYRWNHFLCVFLDVLGQRERLCRLRVLPGSDATQQALNHATEETAFCVDALRTTFRSFFNSMLSTQRDDIGLLSSLGGAIDLRIQVASDSLWATVPLVTEQDHLTPIRGVLSAMIGTSALWLTGLSRGWLVRGGSEIGLCTALQDGEIYGAALAMAATLEKKASDWPRVVIGPQLRNYLEYVSAQATGDIKSVVAARAAELCKDMIAYDKDRTPFLDTLGPVVRKFIGNELLSTISYAQLINCAAENLAKCEALGVIDRMRRGQALLEYVRSRETLWQ